MPEWSDLSLEQMRAKGMDSDFVTCLHYNSQGFEYDDVKQVLAVWEGENGGDSWRWILEMNTDDPLRRFAFIVGWCDYTGWDCQSDATTTFVASPADAVEACRIDEVCAALAEQLQSNKALTVREKIEDQFNEESPFRFVDPNSLYKLE